MRRACLVNGDGISPDDDGGGLCFRPRRLPSRVDSSALGQVEGGMNEIKSQVYCSREWISRFENDKANPEHPLRVLLRHRDKELSS